MSPSPTRRRFYEKRRIAREARKYDAYIDSVTFNCKGYRMRRVDLREKELLRCQWPIRFFREIDGALAECPRCKTVHVCVVREGHKNDWITLKEHEQLEKVKPPKKQPGWGKEEEAIEYEGHLPSCRNKSFDLTGMRAVTCKDARILWYIDGVQGSQHTCLSDEARRAMSDGAAAYYAGLP